jgi:alkanesulfonate monooxygenase SsuD/methylene tetrahydromethanopterin reductase-like flavin-dependent oxidoreductase (luciferase family)
VKLGLNLGYWGAGNDADNLALAQEADRPGLRRRLGRGGLRLDAPTVLGLRRRADRAHRHRLGHLPDPGPHAGQLRDDRATLDTCPAGGSASGSASPARRCRGLARRALRQAAGPHPEYSDIVKLRLSRQKVRYDGQHYVLPLPDGPGKALQLTVHPVREHIPMYLAASGPKNLELSGELFDGWLAIFYSPDFAQEQLAQIAAGRAKVGATMDGFDVVPTMPVVVGDDPRACADPVRWYASLYVGGMGSREKNFYNQLAVRMGFEQAAAEVQDLYLARKYDEAAAAVPYEFLDATALLGPKERIAEKMQVLAASGVTTLTLSPFTGSLDERRATLRTAVEALELSGVGS